MGRLVTKEEVGKLVAKGGPGMTAERVIAALKARDFTIEGDPSPKPAGTNWGKLATNVLPTAGGMIGGALGPAGAALGGAGGEGLRQIAAGTSQLLGGPDLGPVNDTAQEFAAMGKQGLEQGAADITGRGIGKAVGWLAKGPMALALRKMPVGDTNLGKVAMDEGIGVSRRGLAKLNQQIARWSTQRANHLDAAGLTGMKFQPADLVSDAADNVITKLKSRPAIKAEQIQAVQKWRDNFIADNANPVGPKDLLEMRQIADDGAKEVYKNMEMAARGKAPKVPELDQAVAHANKELADLARKHLAKIGPKDAAGGVSAIEYATKKIQRLTQLKQAIEPMVSRGMPLGGRVAGPMIGLGAGGSIGAAVGGAKTHSVGGAALGAAAGAAALHPAVLSHLALAAHSPMLADLLLPGLLKLGVGAANVQPEQP